MYLVIVAHSGFVRHRTPSHREALRVQDSYHRMDMIPHRVVIAEELQAA